MKERDQSMFTRMFLHRKNLYGSASPIGLNTAARVNLENRVQATYDALLTVRQGDAREPLVDVRAYDPSIIAQYESPDMIPYTGSTILVRDTVACKLAALNQALQAEQELRIKVVYGYRSPNVQTKYFLAEKEKLHQADPTLSDAELNRRAHVFVAYPPVAGHTTGGAVDLTLTKDGQPLDMGTQIQHDDFSESAKLPTFGDGLSGEQFSNRLRLLVVMTRFGFIPFLGEWWHFSYGDREWAFYTGSASSLYSAVYLDSSISLAAQPSQSPEQLKP
jgi:D-alanyl-D-alanine dipeptidase